MRYYDTVYTKETGITYVDPLPENIGKTAFPETDKRVSSWFNPCPKDCKRDFDKDGFPILIKHKIDKNGIFYLYYTDKTDSDGALLPDVDKIRDEIDRIEKGIKEAQEIRKLKLIKTYLSPSSELKTFGSIEKYICPSCRNYEQRQMGFGIDNDYFVDIYYFSNKIDCDRCSSNSVPNIQVGFLKKLTKVISEDHLNNIYLSLGAKEVHAVFDMKANQMNDIHFEEIGIPNNAQILDINLTPNCNLFMLTPIPNNTRYTGTIIHNNILSFYATNFADDIIPKDDENRLSVTIKWLDINNLNDINLLNAIDNFINDEPFELIMNANRTLEIICNQICFKEFSKNNATNKGKKSVEDFLVTGATYGHQLNHLLILICKANNLKAIEKDLISKINWLRKLRNDIAHRGELKDNRELTRNEKVEILSIAILGTSLMKYIYEGI